MKQILLLLIISGHLYGQDSVRKSSNCQWYKQAMDSIYSVQYEARQYWTPAYIMGDRRPDTLYYKWNRRDSVTLYNREDTFGLSCPDTIPWKPYFRKHKVKRAAWFKTFPVKEWFPDQSKTEYGIIQHQTPVDTNTTYLKSELKQRQITDTGHREPFQWRGILPPSDPWYSGDHWWKWLGLWIGVAAVVLLLAAIFYLWIIRDHAFDGMEERMRMNAGSREIYKQLMNENKA